MLKVNGEVVKRVDVVGGVHSAVSRSLTVDPSTPIPKWTIVKPDHEDRCKTGYQVYVPR
jgi:hypothetical protein